MRSDQSLIGVQLIHHFGHADERQKRKTNDERNALLPFIGFTIAKTFGKRIRGDFQLGDTMVLIGRHADEFRLGKSERSKGLRLLQQEIFRFRRR